MESKIDKIFADLAAQGKVRSLSDEELSAIDEHIRTDMQEFYASLYRRQLELSGENRIADLERENALLKERIAELESKLFDAQIYAEELMERVVTGY